MVVGGYDRIMSALAVGLDVRLTEEVVRVADVADEAPESEDRVTITTASGAQPQLILEL